MRWSTMTCEHVAGELGVEVCDVFRGVVFVLLHGSVLSVLSLSDFVLMLLLVDLLLLGAPSAEAAERGPKVS